MKKLMAITLSTLLLSTSVFASTVNIDKTTNFKTKTYQTKASAYEAGFDLVDDLSQMNANQLRQKLPTFTDQFVRKLGIDSTKVTVTEFAINRDQINYSAVVNVNYHYNAEEND